MNGKLLNRFLSDEKGQAIALFALLVVVLLGFTSLTIDFGYLQWHKRELQNTADAAALAGAMALIDGESVYDEVEQYVEANGFDKDTDIESVVVDQDEVQVRLRINRDLFFARVLGFQSSAVASLAVAEVVSNQGSLIPNHVIISFDEGGQIRFSGAGSKPKLDSHGPISVFSNNHINNNGNHAKHEFADPVAYYCGALTGNHHGSLFTGGLIKKDKTQMLVSPFAHILNSNTINSSESLQNAFEGAGFTFASYDYYTDFNHYKAQESEPYVGLPRLIYINGNVENNITIETGNTGEGHYGVGLVIINGRLRLIGGKKELNLEGILYATDEIRLGGNAGGEINGALWSEKDVWYHGTPSTVFQNTLAESSSSGEAYSYVRLVK